MALCLMVFSFSWFAAASECRYHVSLVGVILKVRRVQAKQDRGKAVLLITVSDVQVLSLGRQSVIHLTWWGASRISVISQLDTFSGWGEGKGWLVLKALEKSSTCFSQLCFPYPGMWTLCADRGWHPHPPSLPLPDMRTAVDPVHGERVIWGDKGSGFWRSSLCGM